MRVSRVSVVLAMLVGFIITAFAASTINTTNKWVWSAGTGWMNARTDSTNGAVVGEYVCSGYFYSPSAGWINLGNGSPTSGVYYSNSDAVDYGVNHDGKGHLSGYAWCASAGWINFGWTNNPDAADAPKVNLQNGILSGYAWGGSLGWIGLSNLSAYLQTDYMTNGVDANNNGIPDAWEIANFGSTNAAQGGAGQDKDGDGVVNSNEYVAGTAPTNINDFLCLTDIEMSGTDMRLEWASKLSRLYRIEKKTNLMETFWQDCGLGVQTADSDTVSIRLLPDMTQIFYRVKAMLPLAR